MQIAGRMCQSTLAINLRSVVVVRGGSSSVCELAWLSPLSKGSLISAGQAPNCQPVCRAAMRVPERSRESNEKEIRGKWKIASDIPVLPMVVAITRTQCAIFMKAIGKGEELVELRKRTLECRLSRCRSPTVAGMKMLPEARSMRTHNLLEFWEACTSRKE
jgi:hypothetical protein